VRLKCDFILFYLFRITNVTLIGQSNYGAKYLRGKRPKGANIKREKDLRDKIPNRTKIKGEKDLWGKRPKGTKIKGKYLG